MNNENLDIILSSIVISTIVSIGCLIGLTIFNNLKVDKRIDIDNNVWLKR